MIENLPERYQETAQSRIISGDSIIQGKIKYNDKILHQSKILKYFVEKQHYTIKFLTLLPVNYVSKVFSDLQTKNMAPKNNIIGKRKRVD